MRGDTQEEWMLAALQCCSVADRMAGSTTGKVCMTTGLTFITRRRVWLLLVLLVVPMTWQGAVYGAISSGSMLAQLKTLDPENAANTVIFRQKHTGHLRCNGSRGAQGSGYSHQTQYQTQHQTLHQSRAQYLNQAGNLDTYRHDNMPPDHADCDGVGHACQCMSGACSSPSALVAQVEIPLAIPIAEPFFQTTSLTTLRYSDTLYRPPITC